MGKLGVIGLEVGRLGGWEVGRLGGWGVRRLGVGLSYLTGPG